MGFLLSFLVPGLVVVTVWLASASTHPDLVMWSPFAIAYIVVPAVQAVWRREPFQVSAADADSPAWQTYYRVLPLLTVPAQLAMLVVSAAAFAAGPFGPAGRLGLVTVTGVFSAMFAINVSHELIHRRQRFDRCCGGLLLSTVSFGTFKVVHLQIHHPYVGTSLDFATARRGQSIYTFWLQSFAGNFREAFRCERRRLQRSGKSMWTSELLLWYGLSLLWLSLAVAWWGWMGGLFFVAQSVAAVMYLDCINYLQHYGLTRELLPGGRPEPMQDHHSWTQAMFLDDLILFNLPRHSQHHVQPQRPFQLLRDSDAAPRYPFNYGVMTVAVLVPPLFRRIAHPCLDRFQARRRSGVAIA